MLPSLTGVVHFRVLRVVHVVVRQNEVGCGGWRGVLGPPVDERVRRGFGVGHPAVQNPPVRRSVLLLGDADPDVVVGKTFDFNQGSASVRC